MSATCKLLMVEEWRALNMEDTVLKISALCDEMDRLRSKSTGLSEAEVAANAVIGLDQARESLELGGSAAIIAAVNEYRLMYLAKEVLTLFSRWIEVLKAAAALCLVLATEDSVKVELVRVGPFDAVLRLVKEHHHPTLATAALKMMSVLVHSNKDGVEELNSLTPPQFAFVMHLLEDSYISTPSTCVSLISLLVPLCLDHYNAETLTDMGICTRLFVVVTASGWEPAASTSGYTLLATLIQATASTQHTQKWIRRHLEKRPELFERICQNIRDQAGSAQLQAAGLTFLSIALKNCPSGHPDIVWLRESGYMSHVMGVLAAFPLVSPTIAAALAMLELLVQDAGLRFAVSVGGGCVPILRALEAHEDKPEVVLPALNVLAVLCVPAGSWARMHRVANTALFLMKTARAHEMAFRIIASHDGSPLALEGATHCLASMAQHADTLRDELVDAGLLASLRHATSHAPYHPAVHVYALQALRHVCDGTDAGAEERCVGLVNAGAGAMVTASLTQFPSHPGVATAAADALWRLAVVDEECMRLYQRRAQLLRREKLASLASVGAPATSRSPAKSPVKAQKPTGKK